MVGMHAIMAYGFYKYFHGVREQRYVSFPGTASSASFFRPDRYLNSQLRLFSGCESTHRGFRLNMKLIADFWLSELSREKMWSRLYLTPLLQAEEDRDQVRRYYADQARAKELGIEDKVYNSERYVMTDLQPSDALSSYLDLAIANLSDFLQLHPSYLCHYPQQRHSINRAPGFDLIHAFCDSPCFFCTGTGVEFADDTVMVERSAI